MFKNTVNTRQSGVILGGEVIRINAIILISEAKGNHKRQKKKKKKLRTKINGKFNDINGAGRNE
jgi:hypothetical protein